MGHSITAIVIRGDFAADVAQRLDLVAVALALTPALALFHIDHYYTAYWQAVRRCTEVLDVPDTYPAAFPRDGVVLQLAAELAAQPAFALIQTDYFGGVGNQWACRFVGGRRESADDATINDVLRASGVARAAGLDEFDTVGLGKHRRAPESLERYVALCDALGV